MLHVSPLQEAELTKRQKEIKKDQQNLEKQYEEMSRKDYTSLKLQDEVSCHFL